MDDHLSGTAVAERPHATYPGRSGRAILSLLGLAPDEVCRATPITRRAGGLLPHRFTLACVDPARSVHDHRRSALCCTVCRVAPPGCYPASCPVESGLSSTVARRDRLPGSHSQDRSRTWLTLGRFRHGMVPVHRVDATPCGSDDGREDGRCCAHGHDHEARRHPRRSLGGRVGHRRGVEPDRVSRRRVWSLRPIRRLVPFRAGGFPCRGLPIGTRP